MRIYEQWARYSLPNERETSFCWLYVHIVSLPILTFSLLFTPLLISLTLFLSLSLALTKSLSRLLVRNYCFLFPWCFSSKSLGLARSHGSIQFLFFLHLCFSFSSFPSSLSSLNFFMAQIHRKWGRSERCLLPHFFTYPTSMEIRCFVIKAKRCMLTIAHLLVFRFLRIEKEEKGYTNSWKHCFQMSLIQNRKWKKIFHVFFFFFDKIFVQYLN